MVKESRLNFYKTLLFFMIIVMILSGCISNEQDQETDNIDSAIFHKNNESDFKIFDLNTRNETFVINYLLEASLREYFEKGKYPLEPWGILVNSSSFLYRIDVDGTGAFGVFAFRFEEHDFEIFSSPAPFGRIFYMYNEIIIYKDIGFIVFPFQIGISLYNNRIMRLGINHFGEIVSHTLFHIKNGNIAEAFTLDREDIGDNTYFYFSLGGRLTEEWWENRWENRKNITKYEFYAILEKYELNNVHIF